MQLLRAVVGGFYTSLLSLLFPVSFEEICNEILNRYKNNKQTGSYDSSLGPSRRLNKTFKDTPIARITKHDFYNKHVPRIRSENPERNLNNDLKLFKQVMNTALDKGLTKQAVGKMKMPDPQNEVGKEIIPEHLAMLTSTKNETLKLQIELGVVTGMRKREILRLKYSYIDFTSGTITLPAQFTKTRRGRSFAICSYLLLKINKLRVLNEKSDFLFPCRLDPKKPVNDNSTAWGNLLTELGLKYRFHDLRHSAATIKIRAGISETVIMKEMGMSRRVLSQIYAKVRFEDHKKSAEASSSALRVW